MEYNLLHEELNQIKTSCLDFIKSKIAPSNPDRPFKPKSEIFQLSLQNNYHFSITCFEFIRLTKLPKEKLLPELKSYLESKESLKNIIKEISIQKAYLNIKFKESLFLKISNQIFLEKALSKNTKLEQNKNIKTMIEFSQPNTHKVFHVGHMRNVALGNSLVNLYKHLNFEVISANYYGDEGAHIYKCLWLLLKRNYNIDEIEKTVSNKLEWLGSIYTDACRALSLKSLTEFPYKEFLLGKVISFHKNSDEVNNNNNNNKEEEKKGKKGKKESSEEFMKLKILYKENENGKEKEIEIKGIINKKEINENEFSYFVGIKKSENSEKEFSFLSKFEFNNEIYSTSKYKTHIFLFSSKISLNDNKNNTKKVKEGEIKEGQNSIGKSLPEIGRFPSIQKAYPSEDINLSIIEILQNRIKGSKEIGIKIEKEKNPFLISLWQKTRKWSLEQFSEIYNWLGVSFDILFSESEVSEKGKEIVFEGFEKGIFEKSSGAIGINLDYNNNNNKGKGKKLGYSILLKSDGTSLYITKDLALAKEKFQNYKIEQSLYVVDSTQSLHFQQVFNILERMGFEQVEKCRHVSYGQVVLESGKMSSREGNIVPFSVLKEKIEEEIEKRFFGNSFLLISDDKQKEKEEKFSEEEKKIIIHKVALAAIKYGMLKSDKEKNILFDFDKWLSLKGNTGPYLLYSYARIVSMIRNNVEGNDLEEIKDFCSDFSNGLKFENGFEEKLVSEEECKILLSISKFWSVLVQAKNMNEPALLSGILYEVCQSFNSWYTNKKNRIKLEKDLMKKKWKLLFVATVAEFMKNMLGVLGIETVERM